MFTTDETLGDANAAIIARLWTAAAHEPLPAIAGRTHTRHTLTIHLHNGSRLRGPNIHGNLFTPTLTLTADDVPLTDPATLARLLAGDSPHTTTFAGHVAQSAQGLATARAAATPHPPPHQLWATARAHHRDPSVYFEQIVTDGHPIHPLCRTRGHLTTLQTKRFAPEHHPHVNLTLTAPAPQHTHLTGHWPYRDHDHRPLLPLHPTQAEQHHITATGHLTAAPLMSLRTLAPLTGPPHHIKTAVDLQMTSAIRQVSPAAIHNGPILSRLIRHLTSGTDLTIQAETAAMAITGDDQPRGDLAAIIRTATNALLPHDHIAVPLAALAATDPATGRPLIADVITASRSDPHTWWTTAAPLLTTQPLRLLRDYGIGLESHGQNTLLALHNGTPTTTVYRDFGGIRLHRATLHKHHIHTPPLHGDIECDDPDTATTKLIAALYTVALNQLVDALTKAYDRPPHTWWQPIAAATSAITRQHPRLHRALFKHDWPLKATTAMRLSDQPTTDIWTTVPNPIDGLG